MIGQYHLQLLVCYLGLEVSHPQLHTHTPEGNVFPLNSLHAYAIRPMARGSGVRRYI